jgi:alpha-galactosidase
MKKVVVVFPAIVVAVALAACTSQDPVGLKRRQAAAGDENTTTSDASVDAAPAPTATTPPPPPKDAGMDAPLVETQVSDLAYVAVANGHGPVEKDTSNGEDQPNDGVAMTIEAVTYTKGLGVHAASEITVPLNGQYKFFFADVGVDDEVMANGSVVFKVSADGVDLFDSGTMTGADPAKKVSVDVTGRNELKLIVTDNADGISYDHADWANARVAK